MVALIRNTFAKVSVCEDINVYLKRVVIKTNLSEKNTFGASPERIKYYEVLSSFMNGNPSLTH